MTATPKLIIDLLDVLEDLKIRYMVGGSFASSAWGQPRQTNDLDVAVLLDELEVPLIHEAMKEDFMGSREQIEEALASSNPFRSFQVLHFEETFKVDFFVLPNDDYSNAALSRARPYPMTPGKMYPFAAPEDIVLTKMRWFTLGNFVSDRQWNDIIQVLEVQRGKLDLPYLHEWAKHFEIESLLIKALTESGYQA